MPRMRVYDEWTLADALTKAGFTDVVRCGLQQSNDPLLCGLEHKDRMPLGVLKLETITLEAIRPS